MSAPTYVPVGTMVENTDQDPAISATVPNRANAIMMQAAAADVRFTIDGSTPDADTGFTLKADAVPLILPLAKGTVVKFFEETSSAILFYQFLRRI